MSTDPTPPRPPHPPGHDSGAGRVQWWAIGAAAVAAVCCAGPVLLAALGAGTAGTVLGLGLGAAAIAVPAALVVGGAVVLIIWRRR